MDERSAPCKALVLAGGGARGSYQVGVWRALMELDWHPQIITGTSVGSLNGAMFVLDQYETARDMWLAIRSKEDVYKRQVHRHDNADEWVVHDGRSPLYGYYTFILKITECILTNEDTSPLGQSYL